MIHPSSGVGAARGCGVVSILHAGEENTPKCLESSKFQLAQQHAAKGDDSTRSHSVSHTSLTAPCSCLATCLDAMTSTARCCPPATAVVDCMRRQRYQLAMLGP